MEISILDGFDYPGKGKTLALGFLSMYPLPAGGVK